MVGFSCSVARKQWYNLDSRLHSPKVRLKGDAMIVKRSGWCVVFGLLLGVGQTPTAEACGLKLTVKAPKVKRPIAPSANPSRILVIGESGALSKVLRRAGHQVEVVPSEQDAPKKDFDVVLVGDGVQADGLRDAWPEATVMPARGSARRTLASVEASLKRTPTGAAQDRPVLAAREQRTPVAAGPERNVKSAERGNVVASGSGAEAQSDASSGRMLAAGGGGPAGALSPVPETEEAPPAAPVVEGSVELKPKPKPAVLASARRRAPDRPSDRVVAQPTRPVRFALGGVRLTASAKRLLRRYARWLKASPDRSVALIGHADARGPADLNQRLSERRASAVKAYLERQGIDGSRISASGRGEDAPPYQPATSPKNRCVVVSVSADG